MRNAHLLAVAGLAFAAAPVVPAPLELELEQRDAPDERDAPLSRSFDLAIDRDALAELETRNTETRAAGGAADDRVPVVISSEHAVRRYDWRLDRYFDEVLDHSGASVDLTRAARGLPFLLSHDSRDQYGIVEDVKLGKDRKLRGLVRFSRASRAQEIRVDMLDGIRTSVSVGYALGDEYEQSEDSDGRLTRRYKAWAPYEVSSVPIPADPSAGVGRAHAPQGSNTTTHNGRTAGDSSRMKTQNNAPAGDGAENEGGGGGVTAVVERGAQTMTRAQIVESMAAAAGLSFADAIALRDSDKAVNVIAAELVTAANKRAESQARRTPAVELSEREASRYSMLRAINAVVSGNWKNAGLEQEASETIRAALGRAGGANVFYAPTNIPVDGGVRTQLSIGTATKGPELRETALQTDMIGLLRNRSLVLSQLGARWIPGLVGNVAFPRQTAAMAATWVGEAPGANMANTSPSFDQVTLSPKTLMAATTVSKQLLAQSNVNGGAESIIRDDLVAQFAIALDAAAIGGNTGGNNPVGAAYTTGVTAQAIGANGGLFTLALIQAGLKALEVANALTDSTTFLANVNSKYSMLATQRIAGTSDRTLWDATSQTVEGVRAFGSNNAPTGAAFNKGTTVDGSLGVSIVGDWQYTMVGEWGNGIEITVDPYSLALRNLVQISAIQFVDVQFRIPSALVRWLDTK